MTATEKPAPTGIGRHLFQEIKLGGAGMPASIQAITPSE